MSHVKPPHESLVQERLSSGRYRNADELLDAALSAWKKEKERHYDLQKLKLLWRVYASCVKVSLSGVSPLKELVAEGRR